MILITSSMSMTCVTGHSSPTMQRKPNLPFSNTMTARALSDTALCLQQEGRLLTLTPMVNNAVSASNQQASQIDCSYIKGM